MKDSENSLELFSYAGSHVVGLADVNVALQFKLTVNRTRQLSAARSKNTQNNYVRNVYRVVHKKTVQFSPSINLVPTNTFILIDEHLQLKQN